MNRNSLVAILYGLFACAVWGGSFVIARGMHEVIPPISMAFWRWVCALAAIIPFSAHLIKPQWHLIKKQWLYITLMGVFGAGIFNALIYIASHYTTSHHIALILSAAPIGTLVIAGLVGFEKFTPGKIVGALIAFIGVIVIISGGNIVSIFMQVWNKGDILLVFCMIIWAVWGAALQFKDKNLSSKVFLAGQSFTGLLVLIPFYIWENWRPENSMTGTSAPFTLDAWLVYIYLGVGSSGIAWLAWQDCVRRVGAVKTSIIYYTLPVFTSLLAVFTIHEPLESYHFIGFICIFAGIIIPNIQLKREKRIAADLP